MLQTIPPTGSVCYFILFLFIWIPEYYWLIAMGYLCTKKHMFSSVVPFIEKNARTHIRNMLLPMFKLMLSRFMRVWMVTSSSS